ncbi:uncharacterized protein LOC120902231 isoform X1 [Anopheles arabiensis]|uniref:Protein TsetseEP domain-containing protein n=1 Tax=Anopheles arabiensis TaxID=7173 RepID=A0A182HFU7_ANOAR|nr:uncharacterized protein LOC120902231 isoform X1 [Anopheles arabiensis]
MLPVSINFSKFYNRLCLLVTVFITVSLARIRAENCGQEELAKCARPFQVIQSTTDLSIATKKEDLDKICPDLNNGLQCIRSYTRRCMTLEQRNRFNKLYNGTHQFVRDLCREGDYQREFLSHAPCLQKVRPDYEVCGRRYHHTVTLITQQSQQHEARQHQHQHGHQHQAQEQTALEESREHQHERRHRNHRTASRTDEDDVRTVCCSFMEYLDCSESAARNTCGHDTASFTRGFLDKMSSTLIKMYCEDYYKSNKCPSMYSSSSSSSWSQLHSATLLLVPTIISTISSWTSAWWSFRSDASLRLR